jgi:hypothetical protein
MSEERLSRIEDKLDKMGETITLLARMEERMITLFKRMDKYDQEQDKHAQRLHLVERRVGTNGQTLRFAERIFWIVVSAGIAYIFTTMSGSR